MMKTEFIEIISGLGTIILSTCALIFSIYAYRKVSFKNEFKRKQLDTIFELIEVLQDTIFMISAHTDKENKNTSIGTLFRFFMTQKSLGYFSNYNNTEVLLITQDPDRTYDFIKFSEHPYMVPEIASVIREFVAYSSNPVTLNDFDTFTILGGTGILDWSEHYYKIDDNPVYSNLDAFCKKCIQLDLEIQKWLKKCGIKNFNKKVIIE